MQESTERRRAIWIVPTLHKQLKCYAVQNSISMLALGDLIAEDFLKSTKKIKVK